MTSKINVSELAEQLYPNLDQLFIDDFEKLVKNVAKAEDSSADAVLLHGIQEAIKRHSERFTIELIQKVVDELEKSTS